jgi:Ca2+-transporting ATPase
LCNDGDIDPDGDPVGDPTEVALLRAAAARDLAGRDLRESAARERGVPFNPDDKRMAAVVDGTVPRQGRPRGPDRPRRASPTPRGGGSLAGDGLRTLTFARRSAPDADALDDALFADLEILGITGMQDPPRRPRWRRSKHCTAPTSARL